MNSVVTGNSHHQVRHVLKRDLNRSSGSSDIMSDKEAKAIGIAHRVFRSRRRSIANCSCLTCTSSNAEIPMPLEATPKVGRQ